MVTPPAHRPTLFSGEGVSPTRHTWVRWSWLWHGLFSVEFIAVASAVLWQQSFAWSDAGLFTCVLLLLGSWYGIGVFLGQETFRHHPLLTQGYLAIGWGLWWEVVQLHWLSWFLLFGLCTQLYVLSPGLWKLPGLLVLTALSVRQILLEAGANSVLVLVLLSFAGMGLLLAWNLESLHEQNRKKDRLVAQLEATRNALAAASQQAGAAQERERLADDIHDTLAQGFSSILMHAEAAERALLSEAGRSRDHLDQIRQIARENLTQARRLLWALQPESSSRAPLPEILSHLCHTWSQEHGITVEPIITGKRRLLRPEIEVILLRAAQEGLVNVSKHARARQVMVTLSYLEDVVILDVQDDGVGFDPNQLSQMTCSQVPSSGFGLKALRERTERLGGTLSVESAPGEGTTLALALPALPACSDGGCESPGEMPGVQENAR